MHLNYTNETRTHIRLVQRAIDLLFAVAGAPEVLTHW